MNKQKQCPKCGAEINPSDKFCTGCGSVLSSDNVTIASKKKITKIAIIIVVILISIFGLVAIISVIEGVVENQRLVEYNKKIKEDNELLATTNPVYLASPSSFIIDKDRKISDNPEDNKSVWVEKIIDNNTIIISYFVSKGNETFLTFRTVDIAGISERVSDCRKQEAINYLRIFIEKKYVYLITPKDLDAQIHIKNLLRYAYILGKDISETFMDTSQIGPEESLRVEEVLVYGGYAVVDISTGDYGYLYDLKTNGQEVAEVAKRGFWGTCK